jgi:hypothetical protein
LKYLGELSRETRKHQKSPEKSQEIPRSFSEPCENPKNLKHFPRKSREI